VFAFQCEKEGSKFKETILSRYRLGGKSFRGKTVEAWTRKVQNSLSQHEERQYFIVQDKKHFIEAIPPIRVRYFIALNSLQSLVDCAETSR
jgi:hypothetical protein